MFTLNVGETVSVRVVANASANRVVEETSSNQLFRFKVYVTASPHKGQANQQVLTLLSKILNIPKTALSVKKGKWSRQKVIQRIRA